MECCVQLTYPDLLASLQLCLPPLIIILKLFTSLQIICLVISEIIIKIIKKFTFSKIKEKS